MSTGDIDIELQENWLKLKTKREAVNYLIKNYISLILMLALAP
jgi:hypothetical protein